jgi:nicotinamidase-related amidase
MLALLIIDLQKAIDHPKWLRHGPRNNPGAERTIAELLAAWREFGLPVIHVKHDSREADSPYRPGQAGNEFKSEAVPLPGETVISKSTGNAFIGTGLEERLKNEGIEALIIVGVITNNSVESTARMAGDLGFRVFVVEDACFTFAFPDWAGQLRIAEVVHAMSLANLDGEYGSVVSSGDALRMIAGAEKYVGRQR